MHICMLLMKRCSDHVNYRKSVATTLNVSSIYLPYWTLSQVQETVITSKHNDPLLGTVIIMYEQ